jgi:hypothetical protein
MEEIKESMEEIKHKIIELYTDGKLEVMQLCDLSHHRLMYDILVFMYRTDDPNIGPYVMLEYVYGATNYIPGREISACIDHAYRLYQILKSKNLI